MLVLVQARKAQKCLFSCFCSSTPRNTANHSRQSSILAVNVTKDSRSFSHPVAAPLVERLAQNCSEVPQLLICVISYLSTESQKSPGWKGLSIIWRQSLRLGCSGPCQVWNIPSKGASTTPLGSSLQPSMVGKVPFTHCTREKETPRKKVVHPRSHTWKEK